jgi:putative FmdB family regulatory protein
MIYQWDCVRCGKQVDVMRKIDDRDIPPDECCEVCKGTEFKRAIAASTFALLGGGWFKDGY